MSQRREPVTKLRLTASRYTCADCPPERVCAWGCLQGAGVAEIVIGAALALDGLPDPGLPPSPGEEHTRRALWESFNA